VEEVYELNYMKIIKLGIISLVAFTLLLTFISFLFPSHIRISKATDIRAGKYEVISRLTNLSLRHNWYNSADSITVFGKNGKAKLVVNVDDPSNNAADMTVNVVLDGASFPDAKAKATGWTIIPSGIPNTITVQWYMDFHLRWYPWEKFSSLLLEKRYGPVLERGLEKLKASLEK
jgi:hypothetical protein